MKSYKKSSCFKYYRSK